MPLTIKNKYDIRERLSEKELDDTPQHFLVDNIKQLDNIQNQINYPVIVKPCDGSGSKAVNKVENKIELKMLFEVAFGGMKKKQYLCTRFREKRILLEIRLFGFLLNQ